MSNLKFQTELFSPPFEGGVAGRAKRDQPGWLISFYLIILFKAKQKDDPCTIQRSSLISKNI